MEYEVGKWYFINFNQESTGIARFHKLGLIWKENSFISSELYSTDGNANFGRGNMLLKYVHGLATTDQIKTCLVEYAKRHGYIDGTKLSNGDRISESLGPLEYDQEFDILKDDCGLIVYSSGKWAQLAIGEVTKQVFQEHILTGSSGIPMMSAKVPTPEKDYHTINGHPVHISVLIDSYLKLIEIREIAK